MTTRGVTVQFDRESSRHHISVECTEQFSAIVARGQFGAERLDPQSVEAGRMFVTDCESDCPPQGSAPMGKALDGSQVRLAATAVHSVTVE